MVSRPRTMPLRGMSCVGDSSSDSEKVAMIAKMSGLPGAARAADSVTEVADVGEDHRDAGVVGGFDDFVVFFAATGLRDGDDAGAGGGLQAVGEGEESVGGEHRALRALTGFFAGDLDGRDARGLPAT